MPRKAKNNKDNSKDIEKLRANLIEKAKADGTINQREISDIYPDAPENAEAIDSLYTELADANVEIITEPDETEFSDEWIDEDSEEAVDENAAAYVDDDIADDSVRLYLREIGKIPLLTADEELAISSST